MNPVRVALWIVIAISIFIVSLIIHKEFLKRSIFQEIYGKYKGNLEKKVKEENWFVSKYGVIENRSFLYKIDRLLTMSGLKKTFPHLSGEVFISILFISLITTAILVSNLAGNVFLGLFIALAVVTAEFLVVIFLSGRTYNQIEEDTSLFISILSNHAKGSSDIVTIMTRTLPSMDGPIRELIKKFLLDAEKTGDIDVAFDVMKESVDNRTFQTIIVNLKNCMHYQANYEEVLQQMMNQVAEAMSAREERKNILFSMKITLVSISIMSVIIVALIGKGIGVDVKAILTGNMIGQFILFITGLLYLFVTTKLFGVDK
jgi:RNAse (barnase) inhibitor barstar